MVSSVVATRPLDEQLRLNLLAQIDTKLKSVCLYSTKIVFQLIGILRRVLRRVRVRTNIDETQFVDRQVRKGVQVPNLAKAPPGTV